MKDEKGRPMTFWGGLEPTDPYEKGFIDGLQKQMQSSVDRLVNQSIQKPLSDEEIQRIYKEVSKPYGEKRIYEIHTFARAIEERILGK